MINERSETLRLGNPEILGRQCHPHCLVCGDGNALGLKPSFKAHDDGIVECRFDCRPAFEGYPRQLHGGVIGLFFDAAMTNCLFAHGHVAVTAELHIRYRRPVDVQSDCLVRARLRRSRPPLHLVEAELFQGGRLKAAATAKFVDRR